MVEISEVIDEPPPPQAKPEPEEESPSQSRLNDADEISSLLSTLTRPSAKAHLDVLVKKLRREGMALQRVEASRAKTAAATSEEKKEDDKTKHEAVKAQPTPTPAPTPAPAPTPTAGQPKATYSDSIQYTPISKFAFDMGEYNSAFLKLYIDLPKVGTIPKSNVTCEFTSNKFDLIVRDLEGRSYRLVKDDLEHDIQPDKSKHIIKANKIILKLAKKETSYGGYDHWTSLTAKKKKTPSAGKTGVGGDAAAKDPSASIMELMKDMYDNGDDAMKKMIGETMMKQRRGELDGDLDKKKWGDDLNSGLGDL